MLTSKGQNHHELPGTMHAFDSTVATVVDTAAILSVSIALEVSAFFTAKVPPKPQH